MKSAALAGIAMIATVAAGCGGTGSDRHAASQSPPKSVPAGSESPSPFVPAQGLEFRLVAAVAGPVPPVPPTSSPSPIPTPTAGLMGSPHSEPATTGSTKGQTLEQTFAWAASPPEQWQNRFKGFACPPVGRAPAATPYSDEPLLACDAAGNRYLLSKAIIDSNSLAEAKAGPPIAGLNWVVDLQLDNKHDGVNTFAVISQRLLLNSGTSSKPTQLAIVLDGAVFSAPSFNGVIRDGSMQISGNFTEYSAKRLAQSLMAGAH